MAQLTVDISVPSMQLLMTMGEREVAGDVTTLPPPDHPLPTGARPVAAFMVYDKIYAQPLEGVFLVAPSGSGGGTGAEVVVPEPAAVSASVNAGALTATIIASAAAGVLPDAMLLWFEGPGAPPPVLTSGQATFALTAGSTYVPFARALMGQVLSDAISGAAITLAGTLSVSGSPAVSGDAIVGGRLTVALPAATGAAGVAVEWLLDGTPVAGATGLSWDPTAPGAVTVRATWTGTAGDTVVRTSPPVVVAAAPTAEPGPVRNLRVSLAPAGAGLLVEWDAPTVGAAATTYTVAYPRVGNPGYVATQAGRSLVVPDPAPGRGAIIVRAGNGSGYGMAVVRDNLVVRGLTFGDGIRAISGAEPCDTFVFLSAADRARGWMRLQTNILLAGGEITVRSESGVLAIVNTTGFMPFPTDTLQALQLTSSGAAGQIDAAVSALAFEISNTGAATLQPWVGGQVVITEPLQAQRLGNLQIRYGFGWLDPVTGESGSTPMVDMTTAFSFLVPPDLQGKLVSVRAGVWDPALSASPGSQGVPVAASYDYLGPVTEAAVLRTVTQATPAAGLTVLTSSLANFSADTGVRITILASADVSNTGGVWVAARTTTGALLGITTFAGVVAGDTIDLAPPNAVLPSDVDAIVVGPAGGTSAYSYQLQFAGLLPPSPSSLPAGALLLDGAALALDGAYLVLP